MSSCREVNDSSVDIIKKHEGWKPCTYQRNTIGYGHKIKKGENLTRRSCITEDQGVNLLKSDLSEASDCLSRSVTTPLNDNEFGALASWTYNIGCAAARKSTLIKELNDGNKDSVCDELMKWNKRTMNGRRVKLPGITNRRRDECELFNKPVDSEE